MSETVVNEATAEPTDQNDTQSEAHPAPMFKMPVYGLSIPVKKKTMVAAEFKSDDSVSSLPGLSTETVKHTSNDTEHLTEHQAPNTATSTVSDVEQPGVEPNTETATPKPVSMQQQNAGLAAAAIEYVEPSWGGPCEKMYCFESIKNGIVTEKMDLTTKSYYVFGRLPSCDHTMDHPSLSRYHAVIQHCATATPTRQVGWYLYDLDSTHGTWINKNKVLPRNYYRLRVGHVIKFGGSSRLYILQGPEEDQETESELSVTELKQQRDRQKTEAALLRRMDEIETEQRVAAQQSSAAADSGGCSWGMDDEEDEVEAEDNDAPNPFALPENEELYVEDPKKALRGFFEREGFELPEYEFTEEGKGKFRCSVKIPVDTPTGEPLIAEIIDAGKKKDLVVRCALEACRVLDRLGLLRKAVHESRAKKRKNWEESNFYDSDEDNFLDRTGDIEKKREKRILRVHKTVAKAETYDSLVNQLTELSSEREMIERRVEEDRASRVTADEEGGLDALDAFMMTMKSGQVLDVKTRTQFKQRLVVLKQQIARLERLVNVARPAAVPLVKPLSVTSTAPPDSHHSGGADEAAAVKTRAPAVIGHMRCASVPHRPTASVPHQHEVVHSVSRPAGSGYEVEEEDEEEDTDVKQSDITKPAVDITKPAVDITEPAVDITQSTTVQKGADIIKNANSTAIDAIQYLTPVIGPPAVKKSNGNEVVKGKAGGGRKQNAVTFRVGKPDKTKGVELVVEGDDKYATWLPPSEQSGDGTTKLNAKFGY